MSKSQTRKEQREKQGVGLLFVVLGLANAGLWASGDRSVAWLVASGLFVLAGVMFLVEAQRRPVSGPDATHGRAPG